MFRKIAGAAALVVCLVASESYACSSCSCSFNSEWASEGYTNSSGLRFDVRYDYISQSQLRRGSKAVSHEDFELPPTDEEVQQHTITRETLLGLDYSPSSEWGVRFLLPYFVRTHTTIMPHDMEMPDGMMMPEALESTGSDTSGFGDLSIVGRYQGFFEEHNFGVQLGMKFPTGEYKDEFSSGPGAGELLDRGLQNGTGTFDAIVGVYYLGVITQEWEYITSLNYQQPLHERDGFKMGASVTATAGIAYQATDWLRPQLQVNYRFEGREQGENSDHDNSGGNFLFVSPGASFYLSDALTVYLLMQLPLYQDVNGVQLQPHFIPSIGVRYDF